MRTLILAAALLLPTVSAQALEPTLTSSRYLDSLKIYAVDDYTRFDSIVDITIDSADAGLTDQTGENSELLAQLKNAPTDWNALFRQTLQRALADTHVPVKICPNVSKICRKPYELEIKVKTFSLVDAKARHSQTPQLYLRIYGRLGTPENHDTIFKFYDSATVETTSNATAAQANEQIQKLALELMTDLARQLKLYY
jgi:hypothetical protein